MQTSTRRRRAILATLGLLAGLVPALLAASPASAGTVITPNSCTNTVQAGTSALQLTVSGAATPNPLLLGGDATLSGASFSIDVPASTLLAGYALGLLSAGTTASDPLATNVIPAVVNVTLLGTNTTQGTATFATLPGPNGKIANSPLTGVDDTLDNTFGPNGPGLSVSGTTVIVDPTPTVDPGPDLTVGTPDDTGGPTSGDETATPLSVGATIPATTWTGTGGPINLSLGNSNTVAIIGGGVLEVGFSCNPGVPSPAGCGALPLAPCTGTTSVPALPFDTITVNAPDTAPVCTVETASVGVTQSIPINLVDNCTDVNSNIDLSTFTLSSPGATEGTVTGSNGVYSYTAPASDPGAPVVLTFTVADTTSPTPLVSNSATVTITVLANNCNATAAACSLTEIVVQPVVGTTMMLDKVGGPVVMSPVVLNGQAQASTGSLQDLTVTNARGTSAGWTLSGFVTDLGAAGSPTITLPTGQTIAACSNAGSLGGAFGGGTTADRLCIPGDNMGWSPTASIAHDVIFGDVAQVSPGTADAASGADWLTQLVAAGAAGLDGIGGLQESNVLCSSPVDHSGGTFACDASLFLGVPASAGAGTYAGGLVLTLL
ncbi:MAG: hypothetical protein ACT452_12400 [Microthrixaceae bacterium]